MIYLPMEWLMMTIVYVVECKNKIIVDFNSSQNVLKLPIYNIFFK